MSEVSTNSANGRHRQPRRNGGRFQHRTALVPEWSRLSRVLSWVPLTLVILSLAGVAFASLVVRQRTRRMRFDLRSASEPTRLLLGDLRVGLAREQALAQRVTFATDAGYWTMYRRATARDDSAFTANRHGNAGPLTRSASSVRHARLHGEPMARGRSRRWSSTSIADPIPRPSRSAGCHL